MSTDATASKGPRSGKTLGVLMFFFLVRLALAAWVVYTAVAYFLSDSIVATVFGVIFVILAWSFPINFVIATLNMQAPTWLRIQAWQGVGVGLTFLVAPIVLFSVGSVHALPHLLATLALLVLLALRVIVARKLKILPAGAGGKPTTPPAATSDAPTTATTESTNP